MSLDFSVVVPLFNERDSLPKLLQEIADVAHATQRQWEVVFVDDGSADDSWSVIEKLCRQEPNAKGLRFRRNFGKAAALSAGIAEARFPLIFTMDADLQDDPKEIPRFLEKIEQGLDVVSGWKQIRHDPLGKTLPSKVFNRLVGVLTGVRLHDHNCGFKCYRREVFREVKLYGELHRFIPVLAADRGFKVAEISVEHRARQHGVSKYGWRRLYRGLLDLLTVVVLTNFRQRPQHLMGALGGASFFLGLLGLSAMAAYWLMRQFGVLDPAAWDPLHQRPIVLYSLGAMLLGAQLLSVGVLAELITAQSVASPLKTDPQEPSRDRESSHGISSAYSIQSRTPDASP